jgi:predicted acetyltransferase
MSPAFRQAGPADFSAIQQMLEFYQYELSDIWLQDMDGEGRYGYDLTRHMKAERSRAYVARVESQYAGVALVAPALVTRTDGMWMEQFFIHKRFRRCGIGAEFAGFVLRCHPGPWEVGQMPANLAAQAFWRKVINGMTAGKYSEVQVTEGWWHGVVQQFHVHAEA